jgi:hypothetical protein
MEKPAQWALVGAAWFLALTVAVIGFFAWRLFESNAQAKQASAQVQAGYEAPLADGAKAVCPVTHETVVVGPATPHVVYLDRVYYFSTTVDAAGHDPKRRFLMDPESFVRPGQAPQLESGPLPTLVASPPPQAAAPAATALPAPTPVPTLAPTPLPTPRPAMTPTALPTSLPSGVTTALPQP